VLHALHRSKRAIPATHRPCLKLADDLMIVPDRTNLSKETMIRGIHHVAVHVRDLERMVKFYGQAFGFEIVGEEFNWQESTTFDQILDVPGSAGRGAMLRAGTCYLELFQFSAPAPISTRPTRPFDKGYTHFCVDVTDIEGEYERLRALGMTFGHPSPVDVGHVKTIYGRDPEGNVIEIQQTATNCDFRLDQLPPVAA
jgi:glyoxylase I family protein